MKKTFLAVLVLFFAALLLLNACGGGNGGSSGENDSPSSVFYSKATIPPGETCPAGGVEIQMGFDNNGNNVLDADEVVNTEYVCNGENAQGLSVSGTIAPGNYLALEHNLDRDDLTFSGQFAKEGWIYDYSDYYELYGDTLGDPVEFNSAGTRNTETTALSNGNVLIAYQDNGNSNYGTFVIYDASGNLISGPTVFNDGITEEISATTLSNGNIFIAFSTYHSTSHPSGSFVIYDPSGNLVSGPIEFGSSTGSLSATTLSNGNVFIAYGVSGSGRFVIYDASGSLVLGSTYFNHANSSSISATALSNGNALIAYVDWSDEYVSAGTIVICDASGNIVSGPTEFNGSNTRYISATTLSSGNVLVAYENAGSSGYGTFMIYNASGNLVSGPTIFNSGITINISTTILSNGNVLIAYKDYDNSGYGTYVIYNASGILVDGPIIFESINTADISATALSSGNIFIAYQNYGSATGEGIFRILGGSLRLQKVDSNEVRLWNNTTETLELMLSVYQ